MLGKYINQQSASGNRYLMVSKDYYSKWPISNQEVASHSVPQKLQPDQRSNYEPWFGKN